MGVRALRVRRRVDTSRADRMIVCGEEMCDDSVSVSLTLLHMDLQSGDGSGRPCLLSTVMLPASSLAPRRSWVGAQAWGVGGPPSCSVCNRATHCQ